MLFRKLARCSFSSTKVKPDPEPPKNGLRLLPFPPKCYSAQSDQSRGPKINENTCKRTLLFLSASPPADDDGEKFALIEGQKLSLKNKVEFRGHHDQFGYLSAEEVRNFFSQNDMVEHVGKMVCALLNSNRPWSTRIGVHEGGRVQGIETSAIERREIQMRWEHNIIGNLSTMHRNLATVSIPIIFQWILVKRSKASKTAITKDIAVVKIEVASRACDQLQTTSPIIWFRDSCWYIPNQQAEKVPSYILSQHLNKS